MRPTPRLVSRLGTAVLLGVVTLSATACLGLRRVERIDPATVTDLSGAWNDADSRLVATALINQSLTSDWARQYQTRTGQPPVVIVGAFRNRTTEHIPVLTFVRDLERAYLSSGQVRIVASADERAGVRAERVDQQANAALETRARLARETGAKYMLLGDVQEIVDSYGREKIQFYQVDATLVDLETNAKVWAGQEKIKKYVQRRRITG